LPNFVGKGLQYAQDEAQAVGFFVLTSHDSTGRGRTQISDRNWKVCFQSPLPGRAPMMTTRVDFGVVRLEETCPASDSSPSPAATRAPEVMPNLLGKSVRVARAALSSNASVVLRDDRGLNRTVIIETNWRVCRQEPAPGQRYAGVPVTLGVVKYGERC
jgi:hypothetical protein